VPSPTSSFWPTSNPSVLILTILAVIVLLYFAREPAHFSIRSFCRVIRNGLRLAAFSVLRAEKRLITRNREVLLAEGLLKVERDIEREFQRVDKVVDRDMQGYPSLHRKLSEEITRIDQDYTESTEVPPTPPVWVNAVEAVASLSQKSGSDNMVGSILKDVHTTIVKQQKKAMEAYWKNTSERHKILGRMMPYWRRLAKVLEDVGSTVTGLRDRAKVIDQKMDEYEEIRSGSDKAAITLHSSSTTQFFIDGFWVMVAIGGIVVNFHLISLPMSEMVGGGSYIGNYPVNEIAALVFILIETFAGMALMEALRITKLFPLIGSLDDKQRRFIAIVAVCFLFTFAGIESALAYMRDLIAANNEALRQSLLMGSGETMDVARSIIPTASQMVLGFILPFALTFAIIPFESFVHSARTVFGYTLELLLRAVAALIRLVANIIHYLGSVLVGLYDLVIFLPLWFEKKIKSLASREKTPEDKKIRKTADSATKEAKAV
jgi:hypothetical protein